MEEWMKKIPDYIPLVLINIPGTHDSCAYTINNILSKYAQTQDLSIKEQLVIGVRILDIRLAIDQLSTLLHLTDDELITCHGVCNCHSSNKIFDKLTFKKVLLTVKDFLTSHPSETIILRIAKGRGDINKIRNKAEALSRKIFENSIIEFNGKLTLGQARGKIVLNYQSTGRGLHEYHRKISNDKLFTISGEQKIKEVKDLLENNLFTLDEVLEDVNKHNNRYPIFYEVSCTGETDNPLSLPLPRKCAEPVLFFFLDYEFYKGFYYGWINFDFINFEICKKIVVSNKNY